MDTSDEYIKMCICPEVQKQWKLPHDDQDYIYHYRTGFRLNGNQVRPNDRDAGWVADEKVGFMNGQLIWLPRQDQIQEMYGWIETSIPSITLALRFTEFCDTEGDGNVDIRKGSMEQLWLAFYMYEEHKKEWDGEKWKKSGK